MTAKEIKIAVNSLFYSLFDKHFFLIDIRAADSPTMPTLGRSGRLRLAKPAAKRHRGGGRKGPDGMLTRNRASGNEQYGHDNRNQQADKD